MNEKMQKQRITQVNQTIELGLSQLKLDQKVLASEAYQRIKKKIQAISKCK